MCWRTTDRNHDDHDLSWRSRFYIIPSKLQCSLSIAPIFFFLIFKIEFGNIAISTILYVSYAAPRASHDRNERETTIHHGGGEPELAAEKWWPTFVSSFFFIISSAQILFRTILEWSVASRTDVTRSLQGKPRESPCAERRTYTT